MQPPVLQQSTDKVMACLRGASQAGSDTLREFEDQLNNYTGAYVDELLGTHFPNLAGFVKRAEAAARRAGDVSGQELPGYGAREAAPVVRDFSDKWGASIEALNK